MARAPKGPEKNNTKRQKVKKKRLKSSKIAT
jgi:hypothetical protein